MECLNGNGRRKLPEMVIFTAASFSSFVVDYILFLVFNACFLSQFSMSQALVCSNVLARILSGCFNYLLNSTLVFQGHDSRKNTFVQYVLLAAGILCLNTVILYLFTEQLSIPEKIAKIMTECFLFILSFLFQKFIIFGKRKSSC